MEDCEFIRPINLINLITKGDIDFVISKLEKLKVIGEALSKYWEKNKIYYELEIIKLNLNIKGSNIKYNNWERERRNKTPYPTIVKLGVI